MLRGTLILAALLAATPSLAQTAAPLAAPPRSIADITAILDQQKPDPGEAAKNRARADEQPAAGLDARALSDFLFKRGMAAGDIGRIVQKRDDMKKCVEIGRGANLDYSICLRDWSFAEQRLGNTRLANELQRQRLDTVADNQRGRFPGIYAALVIAAAEAGDLAGARDYVAKAEAVLKDLSRGGRGAGNAPTMLEVWTSQATRAQGVQLELEGRYREAEQAYRRAIELGEIGFTKLDMAIRIGLGSRSQYETARQILYGNLSEVLRKQGRLVEAEVEARRALLDTLNQRGKYSADTGIAIGQLGRVLQDQGRYADAERLARVQLDILVNTGNEKGSSQLGDAMRLIATLEGQQNRWVDSMRTWDALRESLAGDAAAYASQMGRHQGYALALMRNGRGPEASVVLKNALDRMVATLGEKHVDTAEARGLLGAAYAQAGQFAEARPLLVEASQILLSTSRASDSDENEAAKASRRTLILEGTSKNRPAGDLLAMLSGV